MPAPSSIGLLIGLPPGEIPSGWKILSPVLALCSYVLGALGSAQGILSNAAVLPWKLPTTLSASFRFTRIAAMLRGTIAFICFKRYLFEPLCDLSAYLCDLCVKGRRGNICRRDRKDT